MDEHQVDALRRFGVEPVRIGQQAQSLVERALDRLHLYRPLVNGVLGGFDLATDAFLLQLELIKGQGVVVVRLLGFGAFVLKAGQALALTCNLGFPLGVPTFEVGQDRILEGFDAVLWQADAVPVVRYRLFNGRHGDIALWATVLVPLAAEAVEVRIGRAEAVRRCANAEPPAAARTEQAAFEVVRPGLGFVFVEVAGVQNRLHRVEGDFVDERLMLTGVFDAAVGDDTEVVAVMQDAVHVLRVQAAFRHPLVSGEPQAQVVGFIGELRDGVEPSGVVTEAVGDDRPGHRVDHDHTDVLTGCLHALIPVPDWHSTGRAACLGLLAHALLGFLRQVAGVPLGNRGHDPVHELARWSFIDVLRRRDQLDAMLGEQQAEGDIILAITGQTVELVHNDVTDGVVLLDPG